MLSAHAKFHILFKIQQWGLEIHLRYKVSLGSEILKNLIFSYMKLQRSLHMQNYKLPRSGLKISAKFFYPKAQYTHCVTKQGYYE